LVFVVDLEEVLAGLKDFDTSLVWLGFIWDVWLVQLLLEVELRLFVFFHLLRLLRDLLYKNIRAFVSLVFWNLGFIIITSFRCWDHWLICFLTFRFLRLGAFMRYFALFLLSP
jgi:hypothetical protein